MNSQIAIKLTNISKKYTLHHEKPTLVEKIFHFRRKEELWALKDINLKIKKGEKVGIIGDNGSGKTTLLKIISGITSPTTGDTEVNGQIAALIGLEAGFHPELTGEENIYLNGMILGMSKNKIEKNFDNIIKFSGLGKFIDVPLHTYSSGMKLRLSFSIIVFSNPDILLMDEAFLGSVDQEFQKKGLNVLTNLFKKKTIFYVSHWLEIINNFCSKAIWLEKGKIKMVGESKRIIDNYTKYGNFPPGPRARRIKP